MFWHPVAKQGYDEHGDRLPTNDYSAYTPVQKYVWDRVLPGLPEEVQSAYHKAVRDKDCTTVD